MKRIFTLFLGAMAVASAVAADEVITSPPANATKTLYCRNSIGIRYGMFSSLENFEYYGMAQDIYEDGKTVYMQFPVCPFPYDGYIKGTKTDLGLEFSLPQPIYVYNGNGQKETFYVDMFYYDLNTGEYVRATEENRTYDLELQPNGQYKFDYWAVHSTSDFMGTLYYTDRLLGVYEGSTGDWMGFGELTCRLIPFDSTTPTPPADMQTKDYQFIYDGNGHDVKIGISGSDIYVQGLLETQPEVWTKGSFDGKTATFEPGKYLGISEGQTIFLTGADYVEGTPASELINKKLEFSYNAGNDTYQSLDLMRFCNSPELDESFSLFEEAEFRPIPKELDPKPQTPVITDWTNWDSTMEWSFAHLQLSSLNVKGDVLPAERLSYALFVDGELYILDPADYLRLEEEMTWIPYNFTDNWDILVYRQGKRTFYFYAEVDKSLAVQMRYLDEDGKYHYSDKFTVYTPGNDSVEDIQTEGLEVLSEEYYDVTGRKVSKDHRGLTIRRMTLSDGSFKTLKVNNIR